MQPAGAGRRPTGQRGLARKDEAGRLGTGADRAGNSPKHTEPKGGQTEPGIGVYLKLGGITNREAGAILESSGVWAFERAQMKL
jgi:hypothetical protein